MSYLRWCVLRVRGVLRAGFITAQPALTARKTFIANSSLSATMTTISSTKFTRRIITVHRQQIVAQEGSDGDTVFTPLQEFLEGQRAMQKRSKPAWWTFYRVPCPKGCPAHERGLGRQTCCNAPDCAARPIIAKRLSSEVPRVE